MGSPRPINTSLWGSPGPGPFVPRPEMLSGPLSAEEKLLNVEDYDFIEVSDLGGIRKMEVIHSLFVYLSDRYRYYSKMI